jgi:hypothetical protein
MNNYWFHIVFLSLGLSFPVLFGMPGHHAVKPGDIVNGNYQVQIAQESHLVINGHTNVNTFSCGYNGNFYPDTLSVNTIATSGCLRFKNADIRLKTELFDCSNKMMNPDFRNLLKSDQYPYIRIKVLEIDKNPGQVKNYLVSNYDRNMLLLTVAITIAGQKKIYNLPIEVAGDRNNNFYKGHLKMNIRDFGLTPPRKMLGLVVVDEMVSIDFMVKISVV